MCLSNRRPEGILDACEEEHDEDFEEIPAAKLTDPSARFPPAVADALKELVKSKAKDAKCLCHDRARKRLDLPSVLQALEEMIKTTAPSGDDAPLPVASSSGQDAAPSQPTPTLLLREIGKAAVVDPREEAERRLQHYAAKGFNDFMRMLERRYGAAPPELKEFEKVCGASRTTANSTHAPAPDALSADRLLARGQGDAGLAARPVAATARVAQCGGAPRRAEMAPRRPEERR